MEGGGGEEEEGKNRDKSQNANRLDHSEQKAPLDALNVPASVLNPDKTKVTIESITTTTVMEGQKEFRLSMEELHIEQEEGQDIEPQSDVSSASTPSLTAALADVDKPGHLNNLTGEQMKQLYILWFNLFNSLEEKDRGGSVSIGANQEASTSHASHVSDTSIVSNGSSNNNSSSSESPLARSFWPFRFGSKKANNSPPLVVADDSNAQNETHQEIVASSPLTSEEKAKDVKGENDPLGEAKEDAKVDREDSKRPPPELLANDSASVHSHISNKDSANATTGHAEKLWRGFLVGHTDPDAMLLRFLRARKWNLAAATAMLLDTVDWRAKMDILSLVQRGEKGINRQLLENGKTYFYGTDKQGHLIIYILVRKHERNAQTMEENEKFTIFCMEIARKLLLPGSETVSLIFDMTDFTMANMDFPSIKFLIHCFQSHYPESLVKCFIVGAPWIFWTVWKLIKTWLDPVVTSKVHFLKKEELVNYIDIDMIDKSLGGTSPYEYHYIPHTQKDEPLLSPMACAPELAPNCPHLVEYLSLKETFESSKDKFTAITIEIKTLLEEIKGDSETIEKAAQTEPMSSKLQERAALKEQLDALVIKMDYLTLTKTHYHRLGVLDVQTGHVDWSKADLESHKSEDGMQAAPPGE